MKICIADSLSKATDKSLGPYLFIEFPQNMVASNMHFGYQLLTDLHEMWHVYSEEYFGGKGFTYGGFSLKVM